MRTVQILHKKKEIIFYDNIVIVGGRIDQERQKK